MHVEAGAHAEVHLARQPIFDRRAEVYGYELLYRGRLGDRFDGADGTVASLHVLNAGFTAVGVDAVTGRRRAFVNFTREMLLSDLALALPRGVLVVELLEDIEPDDEVLAACRRLRAAGYLLAVDDFGFERWREPLVSLADIVKVDFRRTRDADRAAAGHAYRRPGLAFLAEKVETEEEYVRARALGYAYFQGFFFGRPVLVSGRTIPAAKLARLRLLRAIHGQGAGLDDLYALLKDDVGLSYGLLRFVNSAALGLRHRVTDLRRACLLLGEAGLRRWGSTMALAGLAAGRPSELVVTSVVRARFCEAVAQACGLADRGQDLFLLGLFSLVDALLGLPLAEVVGELPVAADVAGALRGESNRLRAVYELALAYERADWPRAGRLVGALGLSEFEAARAYRQALAWSADAVGDAA